MDSHQSTKSDQAARNPLHARRGHKLRQHALSLATGAIVFVVSIGLMQAVKPPPTIATTAAVSSSEQPARQVSEGPSLNSSGSSGTGASSAGAEDSESAPAKAGERTAPALGPTIAAQIMGMPAIYIHVLNKNAAEQARLLAPELEKKGIALAGIKIVSDGPRSSDLRYFRPSEKGEAMQVQAVLLSLGLPARRLKRISGFETSAVPRQYELWLSADYKS